MSSPARKIPFPVGGLHTVAAYDQQPPGTTPACSNVRAFDALGGRLRGGQRSGLSKYVTDLVDADGIQAMHPSVEGTAYVAGDLGIVTLVDDDLTTATAVSPGPASGNYIYCIKRTSDNRIRHATDFGVDTTSGQNAMGLGNGGNGSNVFSLAALRWRSTDDKIEAYFDSTATTSASAEGTQDNEFGRALFFKMDNNLRSGICVALSRTGNLTCRLQIIELATGSETMVAQSSADLTVDGSTSYTSDLYMSVELIGTTVTATVHWDSQKGADTAWDPASPHFITADIRTTGDGGDFSADYSEQYRLGVGAYGNHQHTELFKHINRVICSVYSPTAKTSVRTFRTSDTKFSGANNFFVPTGLRSVAIDESAEAKVGDVTGPDSAASRSGTFTNIPCIDDTDNQIEYGFASGAAEDTWIVAPETEPSSREVLALDLSSLIASTRVPLFFFRISDDFDDFGYVDMGLGPSAAMLAVEQYSIVYLGVTVKYVAAHNLVAAENQSVTLNSDLMFHETDEVLWEDDGTTLSLIVNGMTLLEITPTGTVTDTNRVGMGYNNTTSASGQGTGALWYTAFTGDDVAGASTADAKLVVVAGGSVYTVSSANGVNTTTNGTNALTDQLYQVMMQSAYGKTFMVDGTRSKYYNRATDTVSLWVATTGTLPANCRLITLYRGRIVMSGSPADPHNWFMSKLGDPFDWDYTPATPTAIDAVAGNNSEAGLVGDIITALIPFSDDALLFGSQSSLWQMTGDPAAGGAIDLVSDVTGVAFGKAWAKDPNNTLYFMGNDGIYRFRFGEPLVNMTENRIDASFQGIDLDFNRVFLEWDYKEHGLRVVIFPTNSTTARTVLFWDSRTDSWWSDSYAVSIGPSCMLAYYGPGESDQVMLFGGPDGYIRQVDPTAGSDDSQSINSMVRFAPLVAEDPSMELILTELYPVMAGGGVPLNLKIYTGQTAEEASTIATPRVTRTILEDGRTASIRQRVRGAAVSLELSTNGGLWALESLGAVVRPGGKIRRRSRS